MTGARTETAMSLVTACWLLLSATYLTLGIATGSTWTRWGGLLLIGVVSGLAMVVVWRQELVSRRAIAVVLVGTVTYLAAAVAGTVTALAGLVAFFLGFVILAWLRPWCYAAFYGAVAVIGLDGSLLAGEWPVAPDFLLLTTLLAVAAYATQRVKSDLAEARHGAYTDPLTGLRNRRGLQESTKKLRKEAANTDTTVAVLTVDLDHFKRVNDALGHAAGDKLLVHVGDVLRRNARSEDVVARTGGEEFVAVVTVPDLDAAQELAERFRQSVATVECQQPITASVGLSLAVDSHEPLASVMNRADLAMYQAKKSGRNTVRTAL